MQKISFLRLLCTLAVLVGLLAAQACSPEDKIALGAKAVNRECPINCGNGMTITGLHVDDSSLVYECLYEEGGKHTVEEINTPIVALFVKGKIISALRGTKNQMAIELLRLVAEADYDLVFEFTGTPSQTHATIVIDSEEL